MVVVCTLQKDRVAIVIPHPDSLRQLLQLAVWHILDALGNLCIQSLETQRQLARDLESGGIAKSQTGSAPPNKST